MNLFQIVAVPVAAILFLRAVLAFLKRKGPRGLSVVAAAVWFLSGLFILRPDWTMRVAAFLGIGRGADLVLYVFAILFIATFFHYHARFRSMDEKLTKIVRELALARADRSEPTGEETRDEA